MTAYIARGRRASLVVVVMAGTLAGCATGFRPAMGIAKVIGSSGTPALLRAIGLQAALFGAFHLYQGLGGALLTGAVGLIIGLVWLLGGRNLWACILLHGLVDFIGATESYTAGPGV